MFLAGIQEQRTEFELKWWSGLGEQRLDGMDAILNDKDVVFGAAKPNPSPAQPDGYI